MSVVDHLAPMLGRWQGTNRLRLMPTDEYQPSTATATVAITAVRFVSIAYTWSDGDTPQDGLLLLGGEAEADGASGVWVDSWHTGPTWMTFTGGTADGRRAAAPGLLPGGVGAGLGLAHPRAAAGRRHHHAQPRARHEPYQVVELALEPA